MQSITVSSQLQSDAKEEVRLDGCKAKKQWKFHAKEVSRKT